MKVFLDTEFTDFKNRGLISIGLVSICGEHSFYKEAQDFDQSMCSDFVKEIVIPLLSRDPGIMIPLPEIRALLLDWFIRLESDEVTVIFDHDYDWEQLSNLLGEIPDWIKPSNIGYTLDEKAFEQFFTDNSLKQHHALNDAMANRHAFLVEP